MSKASINITTDWRERGDVLNRQVDSNTLTKFLTGRYALRRTSKSSNAYVLAMDAKWGSGKTFFLTHWKTDLEASNYPVVYFDAWSNDFSDKPLLGFIAEVTTALHRQFGKAPVAQQLIKRLQARIPGLLKASGRMAVEIALRKAIGYGVAEFNECFSAEKTRAPSGEDSEADTRALAEQSVAALLDEHNTVRTAMKGFRDDLTELVERINTLSSKQLPIFILVDELDRCRPDYAIELLETIKHLFGVDGVYFVIGVNLPQLSHSVRAVYGEQFDAERYLRRFFDQVYSLPEPALEPYTQHRLREEGLDDAFDLTQSALVDAFFVQNVHLDKVCATYFRYFRFALRDVDQVVAHAAAVVATHRTLAVDFAFLMFLVSLYHFDRDDFNAVTSAPTEIGKRLTQSGKINDIPLELLHNRTLSVADAGHAYLECAALQHQELNRRFNQLNGRSPRSRLELCVLERIQKNARYETYPRMVSACAALLNLDK
ncbi:MAG: hypothetical protein KDF24_06080 [Rhodocyclaceae bacterium]|nr:hypothetical protein [Rhodocyclaceae bacterium]MCB1962719.1 hypothetical protein [Rhodocyclaceae bacterium]